MKNLKPLLYGFIVVAISIALLAGVFSGCGKKEGGAPEAGITGAPRGEESFADVVKRRGLTPQDILAAAKTYTPDHVKDEYVTLNSGGQEGNMIMYTVPSMRLIKYVAINTRHPFNGFGYSVETRKLLEAGFIDGEEILWGDTHHPGFSETNGMYDGRFATINDKANPRVYLVDLRDWELKQVVQNPVFRCDHGGTFWTPNSEYIIEAAQYPAPLDRKYYPLTEANFKKYWRGGITYWKFDNKKGRIDVKNSFTVEAPPYTQDLSDAGKNASYGWSFTNSLCSEMYVGGIEKGRPPFEAGCSSKDTDYLHVVNWKKAEQLIKQGKYKIINGHKVIPIEVAAKEGVLFLIPEPKSPHGVDVDPTGDYIIVAGKLDSHAWVYSWKKIKKAIDEKNFVGKDEFGIPIIGLETALHGSVEVGLGPLHNQYDDQRGVVYTSIYVDSKMVKWDYINLKVLDEVYVHYNVGHLVSAYGDTKKPHGKYLIGLNKLSIDRFNPVGPLHPQNHQLVDIDAPKMHIIYDLPIPMGEPHYTAMIAADGYESIETYPVGTDITKMAPSPYKTLAGQERIKRRRGKVEVFGTIKDGKVTPGDISVNQGDKVIIHLTNLGTTPLDHYVYEVASYDKQYRWRPGETATIAFVAEKAGAYPLLLDPVHSPEGRQLQGYLTVKFNQKAENERLIAYSNRVKEDMMRQAFTPSSVEMKNMLPGEIEFANYGCNACHMFGKEFNGPDLFMVHKRRSKEWLRSWILNPEKHYNEPDIQAMYKRYKLRMPNQHVAEKDVDKIIQFLEAKSEQMLKEMKGGASSGS